MQADDLLERVRSTTSATAELARELGHDDLAERVDTAVVPTAASSANVVVVGEKKRGKSSLINALLGWEGLLPVDVDVATSCHLTVQHGPVPRVVVRSGEAGEIEIDLDTIGEFASVEGNRHPDDPDHALHEGVTAVEVVVDHPLLAQGLTLIDTPGVGGLEAGHTEITLATLRRAQALLFVVDPDSPLSAPELRFLAQATERIATVIFVITKTDLYPGWQKILDDDRALIAERAPRYETCQWVAVSSALRQDAIEAHARGDEVRADELDDRSGFTNLEQVLLDEVVARVGVLHLANAIQSAESVLDRMTSIEETRIRSATGDPRLVDELQSKQGALAALGQTNAAWRGQFNDGFRRLETKLQAELQRRLREVRRSAEDRIAAWDPRIFETLPADTFARFTATWMDLDTGIQQEAAALYLSVSQEFSEDGIDVLTDGLRLPDWLQALPPISRTSAEQHAGLFDEYGREGLTALGATLMVGKVIALGPFGAVLAGAGLMSALMGGKKQKEARLQAQRDAARWIQRTTEDAALELTTALRTALFEVQQATETTIVYRLDARRTQLEAEIVEHKRWVRADQSERNRTRIECEERLRRIGEVSKLAAGLVGEVVPTSGSEG